MKKSPQSKILHEKGGNAGRIILRFMARYLGKWSVKCIAFPVILYFILTQKQSRLKILSYWQAIRPHRSLIFYYRCLYLHYYSFGMSLIDRMIYKEELIDPDIQQKILQAADQSNGLILLCSHIGGYNFYHFFPIPENHKLNLIMYIPNQKNSLVPQFGKSQFHFIDPTKPDQAVFESLRALENKEMLLIMGDRVDEHGQRTQTVTVQGLRFKLPLGPWYLAYSTDASILCIFIVKTKKNYQIILKDPISFEKNKPGINKHQAISEAVLKYASFLDEMLALYPEQWYNFAAEIK